MDERAGCVTQKYSIASELLIGIGSGIWYVNRMQEIPETTIVEFEQPYFYILTLKSGLFIALPI